jgi:catechol 2,3-dioxygenase-like lactoylglutathione lyase family enzyme
MTFSVHATIPILRIFDLAKAKEFYVDFLGFKVDWDHRFDDVAPVYMQVSRDGLILHLSEHHGDACPGSTVYVGVTGIAELHRELTQKQYGYMRPGLDDSGWGSKCMEVIDPFGNRLRFDEKTG